MSEEKQFIYKYASLASAIKILTSNGVALTNPEKFNDPNDCVFDQDESDKKETKALVNDYFTYVVINKFTFDKKIRLTGEDKKLLEKLRATFKLMEQALELNPSFVRMPGLDQISKCMCARSLGIRKAVLKNKTDFMKKTKRMIEEVKKDALVSCFSKRKDSMLMWSHYAASHRGVCIEYERPSNEEFRDVIYKSQRPSIKLFDAVSRAIAYDILRKKDEEQDYKPLYSDMLEPFFVKSLDWEYEKEVRCLFNCKKPTDKMFFRGNKTILEMNYPTAIYIGCKAGGEDLDHLIRLANTRKIPVYFMKRSETSFDIVLDDDYKYAPGKRKKNNNTLERLINEINRSLDDKNYLAAFTLSLIVPCICSQVEGEGEEAKEMYVSWCNNYFPYSDGEPSKDGIAYLSGEVIWDLKEQLFSKGNIELSNKYKGFTLSNISFQIEERNDLNIYISLLGKDDIALNITKFAADMVYQAERCYKNNRAAIDSLVQIPIKDIDEEIEELRENELLSKRINGK